jgi:hypothetical protein
MIHIFLFGAFGSALGELLILKKRMHTPKNKRPDLNDYSYVASVLIDLFVGLGFVAAYYSSYHSMAAVVAIHVGASAPLIAKSLIAGKGMG